MLVLCAASQLSAIDTAALVVSFVGEQSGIWMFHRCAAELVLHSLMFGGMWPNSEFGLRVVQTTAIRISVSLDQRRLIL